jgi:hypothetical protein
MVFVYVPHRRRDSVVPSAEEEALIARQRAKGLAGEDLVAALTASGIPPERAKALAQYGQPRSAAAVAAALGAAGVAMLLAIVIGVSERPLKDWLRENHPDLQWIAGALFPLLLVLVVLWKFTSRRLRGRDAPEGTTRADRIDNRPIG